MRRRRAKKGVHLRQDVSIKVKLAVLLAVLCAGTAFTAATASGAFRPNGIVPLFCTNDTIPANIDDLELRIRWAVSSPGQLDKFLAHQKLTWTVTDTNGNVLSTSGDPGFGDTTFWSIPGSSTGTITNKQGVARPQKFYYSDWNQTTGLILFDGETVHVNWELSADGITDDGFGFNFDPGVIASGTCNVTGVYVAPE
jgi:hypothetical protein